MVEVEKKRKKEGRRDEGGGEVGKRSADRGDSRYCLDCEYEEDGVRIEIEELTYISYKYIEGS